MKSAAATRAPRPPSSQHKAQPSSAAATAAPQQVSGSTAASETQLRRRLAEVEMRLRDVDDDAKRIQIHHEQELATLERDNKQLRYRLEELRMEECMTPAEARAMQTHVTLSHGADGHPGESKLLGATSLKYQTAKAEVEAKRKECALAERQLADVRQQLAELRLRRQQLKQQVFSTRASAGAKMAAAQNYKVQVREQLRGLEEQVAREQERFSNMVVEAKQMRAAIDGLLVNQTGNEKIYSKRYGALLDKRKEMAYLMEVCNSLCEERQQVHAEVQDMKTYLAEENTQYEAAFQELSGVAEENAAVQAVNREKMEELRRLILHTKAEREALEAENAHRKAALQRHQQQQRNAARRLNGADSSGSERDFIRRAPAEDDEGEGLRGGGGGGNAGEMSSSSGSDVLDGNAQQVREFEGYFQQLADIVQSDAIDDVVSFIDVAADERYRCFDEMNALKRDIAELTATKASLKAQLAHGGTSIATPSPAAVDTVSASLSGAAAVTVAGNVEAPPQSPTASLAALAEVESIDALAVAAVDPTSVPPVRPFDGVADPPPSAAAAAASAAAQRAAHMRKLQAELDAARDAVAEQTQQQEECAAVLSQVVAQVSDAFHGLGCSVSELRAATGLEGVQHTTLLPSLSIVEQRTEEYLLAFSRGQRQLQEEHTVQMWGEPAAASGGHGEGHHAARTVLRRPDLLPKSKAGPAVHVATQQLPRSTDVSAMASHINADPAQAPTLESLVDERPLSDAELREVVEAKRSLQRY